MTARRCIRESPRVSGMAAERKGEDGDSRIGGYGGGEGTVDSKAGAFRSRVSAGISENAAELEYKGESGGLPRYICI